MNFILATLFILSAGAPTSAVTPPEDLSSIQPRLTITWDDVHDYIAVHATQYDPDTEDLLQAEAEAGDKTWVLVAGTASIGCGPFTGLRPAPLDGPGMGWPSTNNVIRFATTAERDTAASLVEEVTFGGPKTLRAAHIQVFEGHRAPWLVPFGRLP